MFVSWRPIWKCMLKKKNGWKPVFKFLWVTEVELELKCNFPGAWYDSCCEITLYMNFLKFCSARIHFIEYRQNRFLVPTNTDNRRAGVPQGKRWGYFSVLTHTSQDCLIAVIPLVSWNPSFGSSFSSSGVPRVTWEFSQSLDLPPIKLYAALCLLCHLLIWFTYATFFPRLFQLTETICTDTNRFQSTGEKVGTYTGSLYRPWFLTKTPGVGWACNQGLCTYLLPTLCTTEAAWPPNYFWSSTLNVFRVPSI